jgi:alanine dehydrogenase
MIQSPGSRPSSPSGLSNPSNALFFVDNLDASGAQVRIAELKNALRFIQSQASTPNNPARANVLMSLSQIGAQDQNIHLIDRAEALATIANELNADDTCKYNNDELTAYDFAKMAVDLSLLAMPEATRTTEQSITLSQRIERLLQLTPADQADYNLNSGRFTRESLQAQTTLATTSNADRLIPHPLHDIGILEEKPGEQRAPLTPDQCAEIKAKYPALTIAIQSSTQRKYPDADYAAKGVMVLKTLNHCEVLLGIKEVPIKNLLDDKVYCFFSHTFKGQPYNMGLLRACLDKRVTLIDWELITDTNGKRLVGFGRYAGQAGAYNGLRGWGMRNNTFALPAAESIGNTDGLKKEFANLKSLENCRVIVTGTGRASQGAQEMLDAAGFKSVTPQEFLQAPLDVDHKIYTVLSVQDYVANNDGTPFDRNEFNADPSKFHSTFLPYAKHADIFMPCHYHPKDAPPFFTAEQARRPDFKLSYIADISCDIAGPIPSTIRPSTIESPFYGWDPVKQEEVAHDSPGSIGVMAVDNLPSSVPTTASEGFGEEIQKHVLPQLVNGDQSKLLAKATQTHQGDLRPNFRYLTPLLPPSSLASSSHAGEKRPLPEGRPMHRSRTASPPSKRSSSLA